MLLAAALTFALQDQAKGGPVATDKPPVATVDRSAEPALKALFAQSGALRGVHISLTSYSYESEANRYNDDATLDIWLGDKGRFRIQSSSNYWGGAGLFVSDGESLLSDDMADDGSIRISKPKKTMHELSDSETILYALEGQEGFDELVEKDKPLKFVGSPSSDAEQVVELHSKKLGVVVLHYSAGSCIPSEIDVQQAPWWLNSPDAPPVVRPYWVEKVKIVQSGTVDASRFRVVAPAGKPVIDERGKQ